MKNLNSGNNGRSVAGRLEELVDSEHVVASAGLWERVLRGIALEDSVWVCFCCGRRSLFYGRFLV